MVGTPSVLYGPELRARATNVDEAKDLIASGYEYIVEKNGIMLFRRPKRYTTYGQKY